MALIEARKRQDVTGLDISEQPESKYILMYEALPFAVDDVEVNSTEVVAYRAGKIVIRFGARRARWMLLDRSVAKLATKEEIADAQADLAKLAEEMFAKHHPDEYKAMQAQRGQALGIGRTQREVGQYL